MWFGFVWRKKGKMWEDEDVRREEVQVREVWKGFVQKLYLGSPWWPSKWFVPPTFLQSTN
jgi:hypothetical protein